MQESAAGIEVEGTKVVLEARISHGGIKASSDLGIVLTHPYGALGK
jgi:hypothetical protein